MKHLGCMTTGATVTVDGPLRDDNTIVVLRRGQIIGVLSENAQADVKTIRMTFTRDIPDGPFIPMQGIAIEVFRQTHPDDDL